MKYHLIRGGSDLPLPRGGDGQVFTPGTGHRAWSDLQRGPRDPIGGAQLHSLLQRHSATLVVELRAASGVRETADMTNPVSTKSGEDSARKCAPLISDVSNCVLSQGR